MRLEPVFLVAPKPQPKTMPSRRAFLGMGLAFVCGSAIGSACGYSIGKASAAPADAGASKGGEDPPLTGDADHDEMRRLAVKGTIEELMAVAPAFLAATGFDYPTDPIVWRGVGRIARHLVEHEEVPQRRPLALAAAHMIEGAPKGIREGYVALIPLLRDIK